ncbi:MAG TPA: YkgJ family cysteine cluster protein [Anaerolineales bacterium]|nr:YkgJ family cysteine cluster protein [Anaerolineales bacterium]HLO33702.1 YkgJ family cysteine cluster protein [Anaerolineales bacterium]
MTGIAETNESQGNLLCKSCGLCCTGHLFIWAKLRPSELDSAEALGMRVFRSDPTQRGFSHPCPLWQGKCTIYDSPHYPHVCRAYKCKLLKEVIGEKSSLPNALTMVEQAKGMIREVEALLPPSPNPNFRERLVAQLENRERLKTSSGLEDTDQEFLTKAGSLLIFYEQVFGVTDLVDKLDEE